MALMPMAPEHSQRYGVPIVKEDLDDGLLRITGLVEKPEPHEAPSNFAILVRRDRRIRRDSGRRR